MNFVLVLVVMVTYGCLWVSPHVNFLNTLKASVGRDIRNHADFDKYHVIELPNGNAEYRYLKQMTGRGPGCTLIYQVDPKTYKILQARFIGSEQECAIPG